jgi:hypothetical protein
MKVLPVYAKTLLLKGASITGNFTEAYFFVEESLKINHADELRSFCNWIDEEIGGAASGNIDMLFKAYKNPDDMEAVRDMESIREAYELIKKIFAIKFGW